MCVCVCTQHASLATGIRISENVRRHHHFLSSVFTASRKPNQFALPGVVILLKFRSIQMHVVYLYME